MNFSINPSVVNVKKAHALVTVTSIYIIASLRLVKRILRVSIGIQHLNLACIRPQPVAAEV